MDAGTTDELEIIRGQVQRGLDSVSPDRAERLEEYPLARLSGWKQPTPRSRGATRKKRERKPREFRRRKKGSD